SIRLRKLAKLNATTGWRSSGAEAMYPCRASNVTLTSNRPSRIGYPRAVCLGPKPCTRCLWLVGPDVRPGHGLTRVLSFPSPSGWGDQMKLFLGAREFLTLPGRPAP